MSTQLALFEDHPPEPDGLRYRANLVSAAIERKLISGIKDLPLQPFQFGQFEGKRRVASFRFRYDYALRRLELAEPIPNWLAEIIERVERFGESYIAGSAGSMHGIRRGGWHWLAPRQAAFRHNILGYR